MRKGYGRFYRVIRGIIRFFLPRFSIEDFRTKKANPVVYVSHHQNMFGPISVLSSYPEFLRTWIFYVFLDFPSCYKHYCEFTFTKRLGWPLFFSKIIAYPVALFVVALMKSARGIPVYRQSRSIISTMNETVEALENGESILLFPDIMYDDSSTEVKKIYEGFLYIEKYFYQKTGKHTTFVPMISDKKTKEIRVGAPIQFSGELPFFQERQAVAKELQKRMNQLAKNTK